MARFYVLTGKWAGNGLNNEFIVDTKDEMPFL